MKKTTGCGPLPAGDRTSTNWLAPRPYSTRESGGGGVRLSLSSLDTAREYRSPIEQECTNKNSSRQDACPSWEEDYLGRAPPVSCDGLDAGLAEAPEPAGAA